MFQPQGNYKTLDAAAQTRHNPSSTKPPHRESGTRALLRQKGDGGRGQTATHLSTRGFNSLRLHLLHRTIYQEDPLALRKPARFTHEIALRLLERFVAGCPLQRLWLDEDIKGRDAQQSFETEVRQVSRAHHPASTCRAGFRRSHTNVPVQVADVVAYVLSRQARGVRFGPPLHNALRKLRSSPQHLILGPVPWEE